MIHSYKLLGYNIILDIASGSVHSVDEAAFDAITLLGSDGTDSLTEKIKQKHPKLSENDITQLISEIRSLISQGKLFTPDTFSAAAESRKKPSFKAMCFNVSHLCNMTCTYCFAGKGEYGGSGELMPPETGKRAIDFLLENSEGRRNLDIDFFGGEPLLNWDVVKEIVLYANSKQRQVSKNFRFTLTTNGLGINDDVIEFTNKYMHNIVLSLDGRAETNDFHRKLPNGKSSYAEVLPKIKQLVDSRRGKGYYIRGTYTKENLDFTSDIFHLADLGFEELSLEPVVAKKEEPYALQKNDLPKILEQYEILCNEMIRRKSLGKGFNFYHYNLDLNKGPCVHKRIAGCGVGTEYLAVSPDGSLYPCHQFVGDETFKMGDVWSGVDNKKQKFGIAFSSANIYTRPECKGCWARLYCSGGCAANAYNDTGSIFGVYELGCEMFKKRIECAIVLKAAGLIQTDFA